MTENQHFNIIRFLRDLKSCRINPTLCRKSKRKSTLLALYFFIEKQHLGERIPLFLKKVNLVHLVPLKSLYK